MSTYPSTDHHPSQQPPSTLYTMEPAPPPSHEYPAITDDTPSSSLATRSPRKHPRGTHGQPSHYDVGAATTGTAGAVVKDEATPPTYRHDPSSDHEDDVSLMDTIDNLGRITRTSRRLPHSIRRSQPRRLHLNAISSPMTHHRAARAHGDPWQHPRDTHGQP